MLSARRANFGAECFMPGMRAMNTAAHEWSPLAEASEGMGTLGESVPCLPRATFLGAREETLHPFHCLQSILPHAVCK